MSNEYRNKAVGTWILPRVHANEPRTRFGVIDSVDRLSDEAINLNTCRRGHLAGYEDKVRFAAVSTAILDIGSIRGTRPVSLLM